MKKTIKYMGTSHIHRLEVGEDFGGQLAKPLEEDLEWNIDNHHVLEVDLPKEAMELLLEEPGFIDVSDMERIPRSEAEDLYRPLPTKTVAHSPEGVQEEPGSGGGSAVPDGGGGAGSSTVGGSTSGAAAKGSSK